MGFLNRFKAFFSRTPKRALRTILPELDSLKDSLASIAGLRDPLVGIVELMNIVSKWHDRGLSELISGFERVNYGQHDLTIMSLRSLNDNFAVAGRNYTNTAPFGQKVTAKDVYLGNIFGLNTLSVESWQKCSKDEPGYDFSGGLNCHQVVSRQARQFVGQNANQMINIIKELRAVR